MSTTTLKNLIPEPAYKAARAASANIERHFANQLAEAAKRGEADLATEPNRNTIETIIDTAFWASLRKEEGHSPKISLAFMSPEQSKQPLLFERRFPLKAEKLNRLAPAVERAGIHLGVWYDEQGLYIWGTTHTLPAFCFVLEVTEPGVLVVKHRRTDGFGKYVNVAVLNGDQVKVVDELSITLPDCPAILNSLLGFTSTTAINDSVSLHVQLAVSMRQHGRGGTLVIVPSAHEQWRESVIHPISYSIKPAFNGLSKLMTQHVDQKSLSMWQEDLKDEVDCVAGLTAVDGATIINDKHELLAFGAKLTRMPGRESVKQVMLTEPIIDSNAEIVPPSFIGGTRHFSAAQFVYDQRDSFALVASQDGRFTIFSWSPCDDIVHAHRVDTLLL